MRDCDDRLILCSVWHFDDYDRFTRYLRLGEKRESPRDPEVIGKMLEDEFQTIIATGFGKWNDSSVCDHWRRFSKEEFKSMARSLPNPKCDN